MSQVLEAIYESGVLKPLGKLELREHQRVEITVRPVPSADQWPKAPEADDPLNGVRIATGISDLAEYFDDYRFGRKSS